MKEHNMNDADAHAASVYVKKSDHLIDTHFIYKSGWIIVIISMPVFF